MTYTALVIGGHIHEAVRSYKSYAVVHDLPDAFNWGDWGGVGQLGWFQSKVSV